MFRRGITLFIIVSIFVVTFALFANAAEGPHEKAVYFQNGTVVNATIGERGNSTKALVNGDALMVGFTALADPGIGIQLDQNIDTSVYKIGAFKVKKNHNEAIKGEIFYNTRGSGAVGGKMIKIDHTASTDWQWIFVDFAGASAGEVGYMRYDMYETAPSLDDLYYISYIGFFKSQADAEAFAGSSQGNGYGSNIGNKTFPLDVYFSADATIDVGTWLNQAPSGQTGYFWTKFNANSSFSSIAYFLYAGTEPAFGKWKLFKYQADLESTLSSSPVASDDISLVGNSWMDAKFNTQKPGQYLFYVEYEGGSHMVIGNNPGPVAEGKIEYGTNGQASKADKRYMTGSIGFDKRDDGIYFNDIMADGSVNNPTTGDIFLIGYASLALVTVLTKKKRYH